MSPNPFQLSGAQPAEPSRKAPLYQAPRWTTGLWTNRSPIRDAASTRLEEKFYGPRGDAFLGGENLELSPRLTVIRRPGNSVWNSNVWTGIDSFYEFRLFNANTEEIKTIVDTTTGIYDASNNGQQLIWTKASTAGQSYFQSVANCLFWGDGVNQKKWLNTLQTRIPYVRTGLSQNPYNFTPYDLDSFIVDSNGDAEQLIGTILQLQNFYISNNFIVFTLLTSKGGILLPEVPEVLSPGLALYFEPGSQISDVLGQNGVTLTIQNIVGGIASIAPFFGGVNYVVGDVIDINQTDIGAMNGVATVTAVGTAKGTGYTNAVSIPTTTNGAGNGAIISILTDGNGGLVSASVVSGGVSYATGDIVFPVQVGGSNGYFIVTSTTAGVITGLALATGVVETLTVSLIGSGYFTSSDVPTTGGSGTFLTVTITDDQTQFSCPYTYSGGVITGYGIADPGTGYVVGDVISPVESSQPAATGAEFTVTAVLGTASAISRISGGPAVFPYAPGATTYTTSGSGTGATVVINTVNGSGQITGVTVSPGGSGFAVNDLLYIVQGSANGAILIVTGVSVGSITSVSIDVAGRTPYTVASAVPTTTSGSGTGLTINITAVTTGFISGWTLGAGGTGYKIGDLLYPTQSTASGAVFQVTALTSDTGPIAILSLSDAGSGYVTATNLPVSGGTGTGALLNITVSNGTMYPLSSTTDTPTVYVGGNPISDSRTNASVQWATKGNTTIDGSALWINRGPVVDGGLIYNWGIAPGTQAPSVVVNNAVQGWVADTYYTQWQFIVVSQGGGNYIQQLTTSGKSGASAPTWATTPGQITVDGTAKWTCLSNDGDTTLSWVADTPYSVGHVLEETVGGISCVFQLQPYSGITTQGSTFPVYCWQCNSQSGSDTGAAGELPSGSANTPMAQDGGQPTSTATYTGSANSMFLSAQGSGGVLTFPITGDGTVSGSGTTLFPASQNLSIAMLPVLNIPAAGTYTFQIGHQAAMFWGIGNGSLDIVVTDVEVISNVLTITSQTDLSSLISMGVTLTFSGLTKAAFLNEVTVSVESISGKTFSASYTHADYGPVMDSGTASSGQTLTPSVISGPMNWPSPPIPNNYNFSTGTPIKGYPIMSANYNTSASVMDVDTVQISFPSAGAYPAEMQYGVWYHSTSGYVTPTVSPALPGTTFSFYMIYSPPGSSTNYNIIPAGIATSSATAPTWPVFPTTVAGMQAIAPAYPSVTEASGNYTWWNLGPATSFAWTALTNYTTSTFIVDPNSNREVAYEPGVSGSTQPTFATTLYQLTADLAPLVWMNDGPAGSSPSGTVTTTQGGWMYAVALVNTLDNTVSNASIVSASTGSFFGATGVFVSGGLPAVIDPQVDYVAIFRTDDGGDTYYLIPPPASGNGNSAYTLPLAQYLSQGFTDTTPDANLDTLLQAPLADENSVPPQGLINCAFQDNRVWGSVGNTVYWSTGPDVPVGNGFNAFDPVNYAEFPSLIKRLVPVNAGMIVFTVSDIYIISGDGTVNSVFSSQPMLQRIGILSYNAVAVNGSIIYFMTTDKQFLELNVHAGLSQYGWPIADLLSQFNPASCYVTWHVNGAFDQCAFVADGYTGWYRMSPTAAPEGGTGIVTWSLKANIVGGCGAVASVETSPGNIQLLLAPPPEYSGPILVRDYTTWEDNGSTYPSNFILGSIVFAFPGQVGAPEFITTDCVRVEGSRPLSLAIRIGEIAGDFEDLNFWTNDPPQLPPSNSLYNQRFYLSQTKQSVLCRHAQIYGEFAQTNTSDELYTLTIFGSYMVEG